MDTVNSFKGYGKVDNIEDKVFRRQTRRRLIIIGVSSVLLLVIVIGTAVGLAIGRKGNYPPRPASPPLELNIPNSIKTVCDVTRYPNSCQSSMLSSMAANTTDDPEQLFKISIQVAMADLAKYRSLPTELAAELNDTRVKAALQVCTELIGDSLDRLNDSLGLMKPPAPGEKLLTQSKINVIRTWLSAALTNTETCLDGFEGTTGGFREKLESALRNSTEFTSNSLAIAAGIGGILEKMNVPMHRKLLAGGGCCRPQLGG